MVKIRISVLSFSLRKNYFYTENSPYLDDLNPTHLGDLEDHI